MPISTNGTIIARLAGGLYNQTLSSATYYEVVSAVKTPADLNTLANSLVATDFAGKTDAQIATVLLTNLGLTSVAGLNNWVAAQITAAGAAGKGAKIVSLLNDFSNLTSDATYGASASSFNTKVDAALVLSQSADFKGGDINAAATIAAAAKAAADAAAAKAAADKAAADAAAAKAAADKAAADKAAADKAAADAAAAKAAADKAAADKAAADKAAADKIAADKAAAEKILTDAAAAAATAASKAIDDATAADAAVTAAQAALAAANTKAALTDATALTAATKTAADASTAAAAAKTAADATLVAANTTLSTLLATANPAAADVVTANANVIIAGAKVTAAATAATTAATAAATAKTASDAATADDAAAATAQTALNTAVTAATKAAADAVTAAAASRTAAAATATTTDDTTAAAAVTNAASKGAGAAKVTADAAAAAAAAAKATADAAAAKAAADAAAVKAAADKVAADAAAKVAADAAAKTAADAAAAKAVADAAAAKVIADQLAADSAPRTFSLTTNADTTLAGNLGNDSFYGVVGTNGLSTNGTTLNAGDNLDGKAGTGDTLFVSIAGTNTAPVTTAGFTLSGVERIDVTNYQSDDAQDNTFNLALATGVTNISVSSSAATGDTLFTTVKGIVTAGMGNGAGDLSITYVDTAVAGTADIQTLNLTGQTGGTFTAAATSTGGVETIAISSTGSANTVQVASTTTTAITVTGDQNLTLTEGMTNTLTSVNATGFTGRLNFTTDDVTAISIVGGSANDTITLGATFGTTDTINGGDGNADILSIATAVTSAAALANVSNVEILTVTGTNDVTLAANVSPTTFTLTDAGVNNLTLNTGYTNATTVNLGLGDTVTNSANVGLTVNATVTNLAGATVTGGTGTDTINLTASGEAPAAITLLNRTNGVETITIIDGGDTTATAGRDVNITTGAFGSSLTVNASALDAGLTSAAATDLTNENLNFDASGSTSTARVYNVTGGNGLDTIIGGAGNDIISGGGGNDSINGASGGSDSINAGGGNDTINMGGALTSADTIDGGDGNGDKLIVTALPALALTNVSNVETLVLGGAGSTVSLAANVSFTTIDLDDGTNDTTAQSLTLATGYTNATTVLVDAGDSVTNTANVALTITATDAKMAGTTVTGGTGADTLNVTATANGAANITLAGTVTGVDTINILDGGDVTTGTVTAGFDAGVTTGAYGSAATVATTLTINGSTLDAGTDTTAGAMNADYENLTVDGSGVTNALVSLNITGGAGADTLTGGAGNDVIVGGSGNDQITASAGNDNLSGNDGVDTFVMAGNLTFQDTINGGNGVDIMTVTSVVDADLTSVTSVETLTLAGTATLGAFASANGVTTVNSNTTASTINASAMTTSVTINARANNATANQNFTGGTAADTFNFGLVGASTAQDSLDASDVIAGGAGSDTVNVSNVFGSVSATLELDNVTAVENVTLGTASGLGTGTAETVTLTLNNVTLTTVQTVNISAAAITDARDTFTVNHEATPNDGGTSYSITGGAGNDVIQGGTNNDTIVGGSGNDSITGLNGADVLTGGSGNDIFVQTLTSSTNALMDTVTDFATGVDIIQIDAGTTTTTDANVYDFTNKGAVTTNADGLTLLSGFGAPNATTTRIGQYVYNTATNTLLMDSDGNGMLQSGDLAVKLNSLAALGSSDVSIIITAGAAAGQTITTGGGNDTITFGALTGVASITAGAGDDTLNTTVANLAATDVIIGGLGNDTLNITTAGTATLTTDANLATVERIVLGADSMTSLNLTGQTEAFHITTANGTNAITLGTAGTTAGSLGSTVVGGTGVDTVNASTRAIFAASSINGGASTDVVNIGTASTDIVDADFANHRLVETLGLTGASSVVLGSNATTAGISTVVVGAGLTSITSTQTSLTVDSTLVTGTIGAITLLGSANYTVAGGTQANPGNITATGSTGTLNATFEDDTTNSAIAVAVGSGNVTLTGAGTTDVITVTGLATAGQTFTGNAGTSVSFDVTGGAGAQTITTGAGADTITGGAGADVISSGSGVDVLVYATAGDAIGDVIDAGSGIDVLAATATMDFTGMSTTTLLTSGGIEQVLITLGTTSTFTGTQLSGQAIAINETGTGTTGLAIQVAGGTSADFSALTFAQATMAGTARDAFDDGADTIVITIGATSTTVVGTSIADSITGGNGDDTITGGAGVDTMVGGAGNDTFVITSTATAVTGGGAFIDSINGSAGTGDAVQFTTQTGVTIATSDAWTRVTNVEKVTAGISAGAISVSVNATSMPAASGFTTIDFSGDTSATGTNVIAATGATGISTIIGSAGVDQIAIGATSTTATITGGLGADTYAINATGNSGLTYVYNTTGQTLASTQTDGTTDNRGGDVISYDPAAGATYRIDLSSLGIVALNSITTIAVGTAATNYLSGTSGVLALTRGTYTAGAGTFAAGAGDDMLIQWDTNGSTAGGIESIVVDGGTANGADTAAALVGVITVTIA